MSGFLAALQFLSVVTITKKPFSLSELGRSSAFFPAVGLLLGLILYLFDRFFFASLAPSLAALLLVAGLALMTRGLHLDGFVDTVDALASGKSREEILKFLKDSGAGALGVAALFFLLAAKVFSLGDLAAPHRVMGLVLVPAIARWAAVYSLSFFPYARGEGKGLVFAANSGTIQFLTATAIMTIPALILMGPYALLLMALILVVTHYLSTRVKELMGGLTGDSYGAIIEVNEVLSLLFFVFLSAQF